MTPELWIEIAKIVLVVGAAIWAYFRFVRERSHARRIEFSLECTFFGPQEGRYVAEFLLRIKNQGLTIHRFRKLRLRVRGIQSGQALQAWDTQPSRLKFPEKLIDEQDVLLSQKYGHIFVEPGVEQIITFVGSLPTSVSLILARAEFEYTDSRTHSTERVFSLCAPAQQPNPVTATPIKLSLSRWIQVAFLSLYCAAAILLPTYYVFVSFCQLFVSGETDPETNARSIFAATVLMGVLGSALRSMARLFTDVGKGSYLPSWNLSILMRPLEGAGIALLSYLAMTAGNILLEKGAPTQNPSGYLFIGILSGMFSHRAADALRNRFYALWAPLKTPS